MDSGPRDSFRDPPGFRKLEQELVAHYCPCLLVMPESWRVLARLEIRALASRILLFRQLGAISGRTPSRCRQVARDALRPFRPEQEDAIEEHLLLIWPRRWKKRREQAGRL
jgi:hypothetical protein